ncbi:UDP-N-acetylmuramoyl-L-alanine--D-glutamate ligase [Acidobacteriota bacterium]
MELKDRKVLVIGMGKTGEAVCKFLSKSGAQIMISERRTPDELGDSFPRWKDTAVTFETGGHSLETFLAADLIITSPGVPPLQEFKEAVEHGIPVYSEVELAYRFLKGRIIGITGSNGKSTTATLTHRILESGGKRSFLCGNIGTPLIDFVESSREEDLYVTELSSFQLNNIDKFRSPVAVYLNVTPDHIDWHQNFENYFRAKNRLFHSQRTGDIAVLNRDDAFVWQIKEEIRSDIYAFSRIKEFSPGIFLRDGSLFFSDETEEMLIETENIPLRGAHNLENIMTASLIGRIFNIPTDSIRSSIFAFKGLEHRLEFVAESNGIEFINDSKATNVDAALKAVRSFDKKIVLILGGRDKGGEFKRLKEDLLQRVKSAVLLGEAAQTIRSALNGTVPLANAESMKDAVQMASELADSGDVILLAPACTSWDMYGSFEERGRDFKNEVTSLIGSRT